MELKKEWLVFWKEALEKKLSYEEKLILNSRNEGLFKVDFIKWKNLNKKLQNQYIKILNKCKRIWEGDWNA